MKYEWKPVGSEDGTFGEKVCLYREFSFSKARELGMTASAGYQDVGISVSDTEIEAVQGTCKLPSPNGPYEAGPSCTSAYTIEFYMRRAILEREHVSKDARGIETRRGAPQQVDQGLIRCNYDVLVIADERVWVGDPGDGPDKPGPDDPVGPLGKTGLYAANPHVPAKVSLFAGNLIEITGSAALVQDDVLLGDASDLLQPAS